MKNPITKVINDLKKEAKDILEKTINDKNFPIYETCKELQRCNDFCYKLYFADFFSDAKLICGLFESQFEIKNWQDDMSNFSIEQLKFKAIEEFKVKYLTKLQKNNFFDNLIKNISKSYNEKIIHKIFTIKFTKICMIIDKLNHVKIEFDDLDKNNIQIEEPEQKKLSDYTIKINDVNWPNNPPVTYWSSSGANSIKNITTTSTY